MDVNILRKLIRTGEFLENNIQDEPVRNQWLFETEDFIDSLQQNKKQQITSSIFHYKNSGDISSIKRYHGLVMGFLRSLYNAGDSGQKLLSSSAQSVFIVHGHDNSLIADVKLCIESMSLNPIVLREQPNDGKTIIEKLEDWLSNSKCAVILYTPCDIGQAVGSGQSELRARQNVVYEHGLFQGYLGRKRIIVLRKGQTIIPGDCDGIVYISVDTPNWQAELKENIKAIDK